MVVPIAISLPFQGVEHRDALQRRIVDAIEKDSAYGEGTFWDLFWFYPCYNRSSTTLTPAQLYQVLDEELDLLFPEEALHDLDAIANSHISFRRHLRQPVIPPSYNELQECEVQQQGWDSDRMAAVVDDEELRHVKFFPVEEADLYRRACRRRLKAGDTLSKEQMEHATLCDGDEDDNTDDEGRWGKTAPTMDKKTCVRTWGNKYAAWFLERATAKWCRLRGILATRIKASEVCFAVAIFRPPTWSLKLTLKIRKSQ